MARNIKVRVMRILSGSIHSAVSALENVSPEMVMSQSIREIQSAEQDVRDHLGKLIATLSNQQSHI